MDNKQWHLHVKPRIVISAKQPESWLMVIHYDGDFMTTGDFKGFWHLYITNQD